MSTWRDKVAAERLASGTPAPRASGGHERTAAPSGGVSKRARGGRKHGGKKGGGKGAGKGSASLRGRVRGLKRTLAHSGASMTPAARKEKEDEIASLLALAEDRQRRERERTLAKKYHMVKFFERRKLERRIQHLRDVEANGGDGAAEAAEKRAALEDDLFYVTNFPKDIPYVALFPSGGHDETSRAKVEEVRCRIREERTGGIAAPGAPVAKREDGEEAGAAVVEEGGDAVEEEDDFFL